MFKTLVLNLFLIANINACKPLWDNSCQTNTECCSGFCDNNNGQWAYGVCKTSEITTQCKPAWDNTCTSNTDCCSGYCDNKNGQWAFGICMPGTNTVPPTTTTTNKPLVTSAGYLINQNEFNNALLANNYPQPSSTQYTNLVSQAGPKGGIYSKLELAMFLAQIMWESDGLRAVREYYCYPNFNAGCEYSSGIGFPGVYYFGRGYIQLVSLDN